MATAAVAAAAPPERGSRWGLGRLGLGFEDVFFFFGWNREILRGFMGRMLGRAWWGKAEQIVCMFFFLGARSI